MTCKINADTSDGLKFVSDTSGIVEIQANGTKSNNISFTGRIVQTVNALFADVATSTTTFATFDAIPDNSQGAEFMTLAITPTHASNKLFIQIIAQMAHSSTTAAMQSGLYQDSISNALAAGRSAKNAGANTESVFVLNHFMTAGTTSATTFKFRGGAVNSGTTTFNGRSGAVIFGAAPKSSITIQEIEV
tara:strand:+ start:69 stop:638 length:570 start_codon:yes stop_codon:yes gene_type:complete